jgi:hypothetical protein
MADTELPEALIVLGQKLCTVLSLEAERYLSENPPLIRLLDARFTCVIDPANGLPGYEGVWRDARGQKCGSLTINSDGSFHGEYDLLVLHPRKSGWFIEAITVWGRDGVVKAEPRLLAAV